MVYGKVKDGDYIVGIVKEKNGLCQGEEITEEEYNAILTVIRGGRQKDERLLEQNGSFSYVVVPGYDDREIPQDDDIPDDEALSLLLEGVTE